VGSAEISECWSPAGRRTKVWKSPAAGDFRLTVLKDPDSLEQNRDSPDTAKAV